MLVIFYWVLLLLVAIGAFVSPATWQYAPRANQLVILILFIIIGLKISEANLVGGENYGKQQ
jgi:hypothetical protein